MLITETHLVPAARVPAIDAHAHLGRWLSPFGIWMEPDVPSLIARMDLCNLRTMVNLDGRWGDELLQNIARYDLAWPGRIVTFCHVDWSMLRLGGGGAELASSLANSVAAGAAGLKVWKDLGLRVRDSRRRLVLLDDPRLSELWEAAADLNVPVVVHVADPTAFFLPADRRNERLEELRRHPGASLSRFGLAGRNRLLRSLEAMIEAHPRTTIIAAHLASQAEDLSEVRRLLKAYANLSVDISARAAEIGRQPRTAAQLFTEFSDRILFGSDIYPVRPVEYATLFRLLETNDDCFPYSQERIPPQGRWWIYGLDLPLQVLQAVYHDNAARLIPRLGQSPDSCPTTPDTAGS